MQDFMFRQCFWRMLSLIFPRFSLKNVCLIFVTRCTWCVDHRIQDSLIGCTLDSLFNKHLVCRTLDVIFAKIVLLMSWCPTLVLSKCLIWSLEFTHLFCQNVCFDPLNSPTWFVKMFVLIPWIHPLVLSKCLVWFVWNVLTYWKV